LLAGRKKKAGFIRYENVDLFFNKNIKIEPSVPNGPSKNFRNNDHLSIVLPISLFWIFFAFVRRRECESYVLQTFPHRDRTPNCKRKQQQRYFGK
jgi:hypothetical protein